MLENPITIASIITIFTIVVNGVYKKITGMNETLPNDHNMLSAVGKNGCIEVTTKFLLFVLLLSFVWLSFVMSSFGFLRATGQEMMLGSIWQADTVNFINSFIVPVNGVVMLYWGWMLRKVNIRLNTPFIRRIEREKLIP